MFFKKINKTIIALSLLALSAGVYVCLAESFLAAPVARKRTAGQIKQEAMELYADILLSTSKNIETSAYLQQQLCARIQEIAENNKQGIFVSLQYNDMEKCVQELKNIQAQQEKSAHALKQAIQLVQTGYAKK
ncbi:hypothetical protein H0X48_03360 [Candidatus Dependentiae bacterium]|nr:hypothetical protein [Candidatus Dependentiae bacterium]